MEGKLAKHMAAINGDHIGIGSSNRKMKEILLRLWYIIVGPVFKELGFDPKAENEDLPRVWWIANGITSRFPFYAAGDYSSGSTRNVIN